MVYLFVFKSYDENSIDTLKQAIESVEKDTAKLRKQKEPLEKKMMSQQEIANQLAQKRDEAKNVQATFTEKYDRACTELEEMKTEVDSLKQNSEVRLNLRYGLIASSKSSFILPLLLSEVLIMKSTFHRVFFSRER